MWCSDNILLKASRIIMACIFWATPKKWSQPLLTAFVSAEHRNNVDLLSADERSRFSTTDCKC